MRFVGPLGHPDPIKTDEINRIIGVVESGEAREVIKTLYRVGDHVKVTDGPFVEFNGYVQEVNDDKQKLKVSVSIFGRPTPVELNYLQVELEK
jgi:transcriptional antiterminator NusG